MADKQQTPPRINKLIELEVSGRIKPEHQQELDIYRAQGLAPKKVSETPTEAENTAAFLATRVAGGLDDITSVKDPSAKREGVLEVLAGGMGGRARNLVVSPARQRVIAAQLDVLDSALTLGTGAAYTKEQLEGYRQSYFPQLGDDESTLADKKNRLNRLIEAARVKSGRAASKIDEALNRARSAEFDEIDPQQPKEVVGLQEGAERAIEDATGMNDGARMSVDIPSPDGSGQSPEFRVGLQKLLDDPNTTKQDILDYWNKSAPGALKSDEALQPPKENPDGATGAFARGIGDTASLGFLDEAGALVDTLGGTEGRPNIFQEGNPGFAKAYGQNLRENRRMLAGDEEFHPVARGVGQLAGAVAVPFGTGARGARELAKVGGSLGALYGAGSGETLGERFTGAVGGAAAGAAGGLVLGKLSDYIAARRTPPPSGPTPGQEVLAAGRAENIPMNAADVNPGARNSVAYLESTPGGSGPIRANMNAANDAMAERVEGLGVGGMDVGELGVGETLQNAGSRFIKRSGAIKDRMYGRAEELAGNTTVQSKNAVDALDARIARLSETPNSNKAELGLLNDLRADLVDEAGNLKPLSVGALRDLRTSMRGEIGNRNLTMSGAEKNISDVLDAAALDIGAALDKSAPNAAAAFRRADNFYKKRQTKINDVIQRFTGPKGSPMSAEQTFRKLESMASPKGDSKRLADMMGTLSREERADVAATIAARLGQRTAEDEFSPALFIGHAAKLSPAARQTIFGAEGAKTISNLMKVAVAKRDMSRSLNSSRSGQVANYARMLSSVFLGTGAGAIAGGPVGAVVGGALAAGAGMGARNLTARALMNPRVAEWAAQGLKIKGTLNSPVAQKHIAKLSQIATKDPTVRNEVLQLQQRLLDGFGVSPTSRVAADNEKPVGSEPPR